MRRLLVMVMLLATACAPDLAGRFACGTNGDCPPDLVCASDGICRDPRHADGAVVDLVALSPAPDLTSSSAPDLTSSSAPDLASTMCMPPVCHDANAECGYLTNPCGPAVFCGLCMVGKICGAKMPNKCDK